MKKILIVGSLKTNHIQKLIEKIGENKKTNVSVSFLDISNNWDCSYSKIQGIDNAFGLVSTGLSRLLLSVPRIRAIIIAHYVKKRLKEILSINQFDLVSFQGVDFNTFFLIKIAHNCGCATHIAPLGSDVLRSTGFDKLLIKCAFKHVDYVTAYTNTEFGEDLVLKYKIPEKKIVLAGYGSDVTDEIDLMRGHFSREELSSMINLPQSSFYISCGYNASLAQNHMAILKAITNNRVYLPDDYCIIIQLSYGSMKEQLYNELSKYAQTNQLKVVFINDFLNTKQVAALRLVTDLFIHIQTTDATNASILEYLLADTQVINGEWLRYGFVEKDGLPYYSCKSVSILDDCLKSVLTHAIPQVIVSDDVKQIIRSFKSWSRMIDHWFSLFEGSYSVKNN